jgi:hypothetical protein
MLQGLAVDILELRRPQPKAESRCWTVALPRPRGAERYLRAETMNAAEQMFFLDAPLAHVVQYEEHLRAVRQERATRRIVRARGPHNLVRELAGLSVPPGGTCDGVPQP